MLGLSNNLISAAPPEEVLRPGSLRLDGVGDYMNLRSMNSTMNNTFTITYKMKWDDSNLTGHQISGMQPQLNSSTGVVYIGLLNSAKFYGWFKVNSQMVTNGTAVAMFAEDSGTARPWVTFGLAVVLTAGSGNSGV